MLSLLFIQLLSNIMIDLRLGGRYRTRRETSQQRIWERKKKKNDISSPTAIQIQTQVSRPTATGY